VAAELSPGMSVPPPAEFITSLPIKPVIGDPALLIAIIGMAAAVEFSIETNWGATSDS
jgi:hypothetical protein